MTSFLRARLALALLLGLAAPAAASPFDRGPVADFINQFRIQSIPRQTVLWTHPQFPKGSVVVSTKERRLYYVVSRNRAIEYGVGVGREGFEWAGVKTITAKREWPDWRPPEAMRKRRPDLPRHMEGGMDNPLGARAMYLGASQYRIHGSNEPDTMGAAVSSGCIRMTNADVVDLYDRVKVGTKVFVLR